ncbi:unnamed protein product [Peniophora sp. CBMAI 1063]|nr:unnamed protein product [Peniophora sp. CBMAI 1063]
MKFGLSLACAIGALPFLVSAYDEKIYGVNLGSWLVLEPWMLPAEWKAMGGQTCDDCSQCIATEGAFAKAYPDSVDRKFAKHWSTWFTQKHVKQLKEYGINTVRIPLGYWIVEELVDRKTEHFPRGGLPYLIKGLQWLNDAGIRVILDHHALPGAQASMQMFAGVCTKTPQFFQPKNYKRALTWSAVMTVLAHVHPAFASVFALQAVNEPLMDASKTPGYGEFQVNFVQTVRAVESTLGISYDTDVASALESDLGLDKSYGNALPDSAGDVVGNLFGGVMKKRAKQSASIAPSPLTPSKPASVPSRRTAMATSGSRRPVLRRKEAKCESKRKSDDDGPSSKAARDALQDAIPILSRLADSLGMPELASIGSGSAPEVRGAGEALSTNFMDVSWQYNDPPNAAQAALGPQTYDNHLYYLYGGVADANAGAYLASICNLDRIKNAKKSADTPLWFGEWSLGTNFNANDTFTRDWADAQKMAFSQGAGWIFWNFRVEESKEAGDLGRVWSYFEGVKRGFLTKDPSAYFNSHVCDSYRK